METCPECGPLDALDRHAPMCHRAVELGLPRLAEGEDPLPAESEPEPAEPARAPRRQRAGLRESRVFVLSRDGSRILDGVLWHTGAVTVCWRDEHCVLAHFGSFEVLMAIHNADGDGTVEWADERVSKALAAFQAAVGSGS